MKIRGIAKKLLLLGCVVTLAMGTCSCNKKDSFGKTEVDYSKNLPDLQGKDPMPGYSYLCDSFENPGSSSVGTSESAAGILIDIAEKCFLETVSIVVNYDGNDVIGLNFGVYSWMGDYDSTLEGAPAYEGLAEVHNPGGRVTAEIARGAVAGGKFLCIFENKSGEEVRLQLKPKAETSGKAFAIASYSGGEELELSIRAFATYYDYSEGIGATQTNKTKIDAEKDHVILILGQSNATGQALVSYLKETATAEDFARYEKGYQNIKMYFDVDSGSNTSKGKFVPVTLGQGNSEEKFGPEIGIAEVLSEKYPDETFYLIKASCSGAGLTRHFQENCAEYKYGMNAVEKALKRMEKDGLDPEIFAVVWMQGETDAMSYYDSVAYQERQDDYIKRISERFEKYSAENGFAFIDAEISDANFWTSREVVNVSKQLCDICDVNRIYLRTTGLRTYLENNDAAHYDSQANIMLGKLFGDSIAKIFD